MEKIFGKILTQIKAKKNIEDVLFYLRTFDFHFIDAKNLHELYIDGFFPKYKHQEWQIMVRKIGKGEYDLRLFIAIKLWGKKVDKFAIYYEDQYLETIRKPWKTNIDINFRKIIKRWKFPDGLDYGERRKWRALYKKFINPNSTYQGDEWFFKWKKSIIYTENPV